MSFFLSHSFFCARCLDTGCGCIQSSFDHGDTKSADVDERVRVYALVGPGRAIRVSVAVSANPSGRSASEGPAARNVKSTQMSSVVHASHLPLPSGEATQPASSSCAYTLDCHASLPLPLSAHFLESSSVSPTFNCCGTRNSAPPSLPAFFFLSFFLFYEGKGGRGWK